MPEDQTDRLNVLHSLATRLQYFKAKIEDYYLEKRQVVISKAMEENRSTTIDAVLRNLNLLDEDMMARDHINLQQALLNPTGIEMPFEVDMITQDDNIEKLEERYHKWCEALSGVEKAAKPTANPSKSTTSSSASSPKRGEIMQQYTTMFMSIYWAAIGISKKLDIDTR